MCCTSGSKRRTRRWPSSSDWSWCLWRRSSKPHRVSETLKHSSSAQSEKDRELCTFPPCDHFSSLLYDKTLQRPRDKSWSHPPTNHPSPSQEWPSSKTAAEPPSVPSCNRQTSSWARVRNTTSHDISNFLWLRELQLARSPQGLRFVIQIKFQRGLKTDPR